jgi:hypothetical protein
MKLAGNVAHLEETCIQGCGWKIRRKEERQCLENLTADARIKLKCILMKKNGTIQTGCI